MSPHTAGYDVEAAGVTDDAGTHRFEYDADEIPPCMAVVSSLAAVLGVDAVDLEPLHETLDTDALDALVGRTGAGGVRVSWTQANRVVTVAERGVVTVAPTRP